MKSQVFIVSTNEICRLTRGLTSELSFALHDSNPLKNVERKEYDQSFLLRYAMYHVVYCLLFYIAWTLALFAWRIDLKDPGSCEVLNWPGKGVLTSSQLQRYLALQL